MSSSLYEACFAVLVRSTGDRARRAITIVSIVAGLAGTVAFPSAHLLAGTFGWRAAILVFAAVVAMVAVPLVWSACRRAEIQASGHAPEPSASAGQALAVTRNPVFWLLAIAIFLAALDHGMLISHVLPILDDRGIDAGLAVVAASFIGPMQVAGRLALMAADRFANTLVASTGCFAMMAIAGVCLLNAGAAPALLVGFVVLQGAGIGVASVMRPVVNRGAARPEKLRRGVRAHRPHAHEWIRARPVGRGNRVVRRGLRPGRPPRGRSGSHRDRRVARGVESAWVRCPSHTELRRRTARLNPFVSVPHRPESYPSVRVHADTQDASVTSTVRFELVVPMDTARGLFMSIPARVSPRTDST